MNYTVTRRPPWRWPGPQEEWVDVEVAPGAAATPILTYQVEERFWNRNDRRRVGTQKFTIQPPDRPI